MSGLTIGQRVGDDLRFGTVTSSPESPRLVQKSLQILVKRIRRSGRKFQYCAVRTCEGFGVIHFLWRGDFIPVEWLRRQWFEIHRAFEVWLTKVRDLGIARYFVAQYMSGQSMFVRGSCSRRWIFRGAGRAFKLILKVDGFVAGLADWKGILLFQSILELSGIG